MPRGDGWREGHRLLAARAVALPELLRRALAQGAPSLPWDPARVRRVVTSGVGSSAAHARLLAVLLQEAGLAARFVPLTAFAAPPAAAARADALVVFSQGWSPNARLALRHVEQWAGVVLVTAVPAAGEASMAAPADAPPSGALADRQRDLDALAARGVVIHRVLGAEEYGTLLRLSGPMTGYAAAFALARAAAAAAGRAATGLLPALPPIDAVCAAVAGAEARLAREHAGLDAGALRDGLGLLASGTYGELLANLRAKVLEGMLLPEPPVWDLLEFAHGPFQQAFANRVTLLALSRSDAPGEAELLDRLEGMLVPERHRLVRWCSSLPGALALFEHEALLNALVLRFVAERGIDQVRWPGRGADRALYGVEELLPADDGLPPAARPTPPARVPAVAGVLAHLTWREVDVLLASGCRTAVLPLGSTEQHGPHLPFATDTLIADAVAERVCVALDGVLRLPTLALGCAAEHLAFAGTLSLAAATLEAILRDVGLALARHGFTRLLVFSAHGGNYGVLRTASARVGPSVAPLRLEAFCDFARLTEVLEGVAARFGVGADEAGQHAGEIETSILLLLAPALVRRDELRRGLTGSTLAADEIFYPDLRRHAPDGTVGDPRGADAARAEAYLDAWAGLLVAAWSSAPDAK